MHVLVNRLLLFSESFKRIERHVKTHKVTHHIFICYGTHQKYCLKIIVKTI